MQKYNVFYKGTLIGVLTVSDEDYSYTPDAKAVAALEAEGEVLLFEAKATQNYSHPIKFYKSRIENCSRFPDLKIGYHTDPYSLKSI